MRTERQLPTQPATTLDDVYLTLSPEPLRGPEQLQAFYKAELNAVRGGDKVQHMKLGLNRSFGGVFYKCFLYGHSGVGKSTELSRLIADVDDKYNAIRFSAFTDLDPANLQPFDVLLLMMVRVVEQTALPIEQGGAGSQPSKRLQQAILDWFATETHTHEQKSSLAGSVEAGGGVKDDSLWNKVLGLFGNIKGEVKYASDRNTQVVEYRLRRLSTLIGLLNHLFYDCNEALRAATNREWLLIGEDFDRAGIPGELTRALFINYANIFKDLDTHLIFNIPISLVYSEHQAQIAALSGGPYCLYDTPVFRIDHTPHQEGRRALKNILDARLAPALFATGQQQRFLVASGGNLRNLFAMVSNAADNALLRPDARGIIEERDATAAINEMRTTYERSLGQGGYDEEEIPYAEKAQLLRRIYDGDRMAFVPSKELHSLLRARAVQEFNGTGWFGVHPLVVDVLHAQNVVPEINGYVPGSTREPNL